MIYSKKRAAENDNSTGEPIKKKSNVGKESKRAPAKKQSSKIGNASKGDDSQQKSKFPKGAPRKDAVNGASGKGLKGKSSFKGPKSDKPGFKGPKSVKPGIKGGKSNKQGFKSFKSDKPGFKGPESIKSGYKSSDKSPRTDKPNFKASDKGNSAPGTGEKTDWRKFKQDKKDLKLKRKKSKDLYEISVEAKHIYEKLKCRRTEKKKELVEKLYNLISADETIKKLIMAHDTARIIQCMLKFASPALREEISQKLLPLAVDMSISKYSHFCVLRMFKYGSPITKSKLVDSFMGNIVRLACHNISSKLLDHAYLTVANAQQKIHMRQEFYGELYRKTKDASVKTLSDTYKDTPNMKASILGSVKSNLEHVANKQLVDNSLVHAVMLEYMRECEEDKIEEAVSAFAPLIPMMLTTEAGCQAAIICFYKSTPKNRRAIIKTIKEHLLKICTHEHGHVFMLALLNSLDDTKATKKAIFDNIYPDLQALMVNQWGRRVIEWLVAPADTNCFHPAFIATMEEGLQYGKKDKEMRRKEIFEQIEEPLVEAITVQPPFWLLDKHIGLITAEILKRFSAANFVTAVNALARVVADPSWEVRVGQIKEKTKKAHDVEEIIAEATNQRKKARKAKKQGEDGVVDNIEVKEKTPEQIYETGPGIEDAGMHIVLKKIVKHDKERLSQGEDAETFGSILVENLTADTLLNWVKVNRGCFILLNILEHNSDKTKAALKERLQLHLPDLKQQTTSGAKLLLKKLDF